MKPRMFDSQDPITISSFLDQLKASCDSIEVSEGMVLWTLPNFTKEGPCASFSSQLVPVGFRKDAYGRLANGGDMTGSNVEVVKHLLKSNATNANNGKVLSEKDHLVKLVNESTV